MEGRRALVNFEVVKAHILSFLKDKMNKSVSPKLKSPKEIVKFLTENTVLLRDCEINRKSNSHVSLINRILKKMV